MHHSVISFESCTLVIAGQQQQQCQTAGSAGSAGTINQLDA